MFSSQTLLNQTLIVDADPGAGPEIFYAFRAPAAITIENVYVVAEQTQNAGTAVTLQVLNWGTAGTGVVTDGTVHAALGGTASDSRLTARTPAAATINRSQNFLTAGEWVVVNYAEEGAGWIAGDRFHINIEYVIGKGNTTATS